MIGFGVFVRLGPVLIALLLLSAFTGYLLAVALGYHPC